MELSINQLLNKMQSTNSKVTKVTKKSLYQEVYSKKKTLTESEELQKIEDAKRTKKLQDELKANELKPMVIQIMDAINTKDNSMLIGLIVKYGIKEGFFNKSIEDKISKHPQLIGKIIVNNYLAHTEGTHARLLSKFKPLVLRYTQSKKDIKHHNRVEREIVKLNPNYTPNFIEEVE